MASPQFHRRIRVLLGAAVVAMLAWRVVPGTAPDRTAFAWAARAIANPPFFIDGFGTRDTPWSLRTLTSQPGADERAAPWVVSLDDDPQGVFQSSPPSPVDMAVVFSNLHRLAVKKAACAAVLAWDEPDAIGLAALEKTLSRFDSLAMAAPLSRGATAGIMPSAFRRTSIPVSGVGGDVSMLPRVNRLAVPDMVLAGERTMAGFQVLESSGASDGPPPLLALWEDRVLFAFPLVVLMQRLGVKPDSVEVRPGRFLRLGRNGPLVPIDLHGRLDAPLAEVKPLAEIPAAALIQGGAELFPRQAPDPVILRDDRSAVEPATAAFSRGLAAVIAGLASDAGLAAPANYPRPGAARELGLLAVWCALLAAVSGLPRFARNIGFAGIAAAIVIVQLIGFAAAQAWWPGFAALIATAGAALACLRPLPDARPAVVRMLPKPPAPVRESAAVREAEPGVSTSTPSPDGVEPTVVPVAKAGSRPLPSRTKPKKRRK